MDTALPLINKQSLKPGQHVTWGGGSCRAEVVEDKGYAVKIKLTHDAESEFGSFPRGTLADLPREDVRLLS